MAEPQVQCFGPFVFEPHQARLRRGRRILPLTRKACEVLQYLATHPGQMVTKEALFQAVWPDTAVSDAVLTNRIAELREALGDDAKRPRFIATVHRRGYRFVAALRTSAATSRDDRARTIVMPTSQPALPVLVGREAALTRLHDLYTAARNGHRRVAFVTGEAGIGKTALVETFEASVWPESGLWLGHGQCIEQYGAGEAYLPLLEALDRLCRGPEGERLVALLTQYAPSWVVQLPGLLSARALADLQQTLVGTTRARMLRELCLALEAVSAEQPLVLVLEDLHWSDPSTVEALTMLAQRREPARLLVVGTYRAAEVVVREHPLKTVKHELIAKGQAVEVTLSSLSQAAVQAYVAVRVADHDAAAVLAPVVYRRTHGHPIFMVQVTDYLVQTGEPLLTTPTSLVALERALPQGLRELIEAQLGQLTAEEQQVLEGSSVAGAEFAVASVAAGLQMAPAAVEAVCEALVRQGRFLEDRGLVEWLDGTVSGRYGWRHALYQEVVYRRLGPVRQTRWHRRVGARLEQAYGERAHEVAAELALHFERGQDPWRAVQYLRQAADNALQRQAPYEAITLLTTGLALLATLPETSARAQQELAMQWALTVASSDVKGPADTEVGQTLARVRALCAQVGETPQRFLMLMGFYWFHVLRGALSTALEVGEELARLAQRTAKPADLLLAHDALGYAGFLQGDYETAQTHCTQAMAWLDPLTLREQAADYDYAPGVFCLSTGANVLWCLGFPSQALQRSQEAIALAQVLAHPPSLAFTQLYAAYLHQRRREVLAVRTQAEALLTLATAHGFPHHAGYGTFWRGWALTRQGGQQAAGLAQMSQGLEALVATGSLVARPLCLIQLAEATGHAGDVDAGLRLLAEAIEAYTTGERGDGLAEAYRLKGELLLQGGGILKAAEAAACFEQALSIARRQQAKSWELRAAMSLSRLWQQQGKRADAYALLEPVYAWFTEGFDTADLQEARALLEVLA